MSAELEQRQRILSFCQQRGIAEPNFSSSLDLSRAIAAALNSLDGGGSSGVSASNLTARREVLQADLNANIAEVSRIEQELNDAKKAITTVKALKLIAQIEQLAQATSQQSGN
jgi:hypothetical protein